MRISANFLGKKNFIMIRTRFAPSPTGFLHIGGARTALFSWAYAQRHNGQFILRIEDTDLERSTQQSVDSILEAMTWLGLGVDEGPFYQTLRMDRYKQVIDELLNKQLAYHCYCSKEELDQMREEQKAQGLKPKYDQRCLHNPVAKPGVAPVVRFKTPRGGSVVWQDLVKGRIEVSNAELDDLIIARSDGTPTYNFCVVVDDWDMQITHIIRGDDHVNNTPRQINILQALNADVPIYAHVPMILRDDGQKMSKRTDAVSVMQYKNMGILPQALLNYLARLCWGHGDDEIFSLEQFIQWFDMDNVSTSPARFDIKKLFWVNAQHIKQTANQDLERLVLEAWQNQDTDYSKTVLNKVAELTHIKLVDILEIVKPRADNINALAFECGYFYHKIEVNAEDATKYLTEDGLRILDQFAHSIAAVNNWELAEIKQLIKDFCKLYNLKMPELGMPLRLKLCGVKETPSFDAVIYTLGKSEVLQRLNCK
ncbi:MAG: glutamyl-tRNA synthetase [Pseudomonadota bacterium]|nr:glutamyl-tRNA synthetase [Pseudomonadota bacterium]